MSDLKTTIAQLADQFAEEIVHAVRSKAFAERFAEEIGHAIQSMSLDELASLSHGIHHGPNRSRARHTSRHRGAGLPVPHLENGHARRTSKRLARRSPQDITRMVAKIVDVVKAHKTGINAEGIKAALKIQRKELPKPLAMALASKKIKKKGQKRATIYFAGGSSSPSPRASTRKRAKPARRKAHKVAKRHVAKRAHARKKARPTAKAHKRRPVASRKATKTATPAAAPKPNGVAPVAHAG